MNNSIWFAANGTVYYLTINKHENDFEIKNIKTNEICATVNDKSSFNDFVCEKVKKSYIFFNKEYLRIVIDSENEMIAMPFFFKGKSIGVEIVKRNRITNVVTEVYDIFGNVNCQKHSA